MKPRKSRWLVGSISFFLLVATIIQIGILTFDYIEEQTSDKVLIAVLILIVIVLLSVIATTIDLIRRKITIERPVNKILDATDRIAKGDFSVRLDATHEYGKHTEYDLIMENVNTLAAELGKSEVLKTDFISNVSHELKTPLAVIQNYAVLLQDETLDEKTRAKYAKTIKQAAGRLSALITNILKLNKLEHQQLSPEFEKYNLTDALAQAVIALEDWIESKHLQMDCDLQDVTLFSSPTLLEIVWNNLLSNAVKFTDNGGSIFVKLTTKNDLAIVEITDTGCGISPETGARIFEKFYQGDTSHAQEGNGLGLPLVKKVIDILGGQISVRSQLGEGTTFTVTLKGVIHA